MCLQQSRHVIGKMSVRKHLPLMQVLKELKNYQRQIVLDHLEPSACDSLVKCISTVLKHGNNSKKLNSQKKGKLRAIVKKNKKNFAKIISKSARKNVKKRALAQMGGNPLALVLSTAIPIILELMRD